MPRRTDRENNDVASPESSNHSASPPSGNPPELNIKIPRLRDINPPFKKRDPNERTEVVLLTVKDAEFLSCYAYLDNVYCSNITSIGKVYFGEIVNMSGNKVKVSLIRCGEGGADAQGSLNAVSNAVAALQPKAVICSGYCGGLNKSKAKLGDVVISRKLGTYSHVKITSDGEEQRGGTSDVSRFMSSLIKSAADGWNPPLKNQDIEVAVLKDKVMLSGPQLVDDETRRNELLKAYPNAIAIEMEGEGVYAAAYNLQIEWVVIKGISDYADGSKTSSSAWRPFASVMAASVIHNMLRQPEVLDEWPHYKKT